MKTLIINAENFNKYKLLGLNCLQTFFPEETEESMFKTINNNCFYCFVFNENNDVVCWSRVARPWDRKTIYIIRQIETKNEEKGKGFAKICYSAIEKYLSEIDDAKKLVAFVDDDNIASIKLHQNTGFERNSNPSKYLKNLYGWDSAIMYEKKINQNENFNE